MKPKTMILMIVAITCGLGASYMTSRLLADRGEEVKDKVDVLVAKKKLNMGELIKNPSELFEFKKYDKGDEPRDAVTELKDLKGKFLNRSMVAGDPLHGEDVTADYSLAARLPKGYRAVGIRVDPASIAGGFAALPMSKVDIMYTVRRGDDKTTFSKVLLEDVLVLAADTASVRADGGGAMVANVVTVALKPEDAAKFELAKSGGTITLALRALGEERSERLASTTWEQMFTKSSKQDDIVEVPSSNNPQAEPPPVALIPDVRPMDPKNATPIQVTPKTQPDQPELPALHKHRVTEINGGHQVVWEYTLDEDDNVIDRRLVPASK